MPLTIAIPRNRYIVMLIILLLVVGVAILDWWSGPDFPLGFLYLFPMLLAGVRLRRWQIAALAIVCTVLTELFDVFNWTWLTGPTRDGLYFIAFFCMGLFFYESQRSRQIMQENLTEIERQSAARREAEEQLQFLVESSPVAIFVATADGTVLMANDAAHRLLMLPADSLPGRSLRPYFPSLGNVPEASANRPSFRTMMQAHAQRENGEAFFAEIWFSTYRTGNGARLAAMVMDASENLRDREETSMVQAGQSSRLAVSAIAHEIRNICGAIAVVHRNLFRKQELQQDKDFEALGNLVLALEGMASMELHHSPGDPSEVELALLLEEFRIIAAPAMHDADIEASWNIADDLPPVWADRKGLMLICLNLSQNSIRSLAEVENARFSVSAFKADDKISSNKIFVEFADNGPGVADPDRLFRPFQPEAQSTGLGLYLSRAFARSFHGELRHMGHAPGACFRLELEIAAEEEHIDDDGIARHSHA
jgi:PAS domain S-box-containing protein